MEPGANKRRLLYVSDYNNNIVQVYNYPSHGTQNPPAGTPTGIPNPFGMCIDKHHHVYITSVGSLSTLKYKFGGTNPIEAYHTSGAYPIACALDPTSNSVAITGRETTPNYALSGVFVFKLLSHWDRLLPQLLPKLV
jgi:hypothetical protein